MKKNEPPKDLLDWLGISEAPNWGVSRPLGGLIAMLIGLLVILALSAAVVMLVQVAGGAAASLGAGALIVAVLSAPFLIWGTWIKHRALGFQKEGHLTDRLAKAVEQLGAEKTVKKIVDGTTQETSEPNLEVRIGGLLSLERIAQDSSAYDQGRDHVRVMEIICAYIRNNAPASMAQDFPEGDLEPLDDEADAEQIKAHIDLIGNRRTERRKWLAGLKKPTEDIALALLILERRSDRQRRSEAAHGQDGVTAAQWVFAEACPTLPEPPKDQPHPPGAIKDFEERLADWKRKLADYRGYRPDLRGTCLQRADLAGLHLGGVRLESARLEGAELWGARLEGAELWGARLEGASLGRARLEGAELWGARLEGASLGRARLEGAELGRARLEGAELWGARLEGAKLWGARLEGAELGRARLEGAELWEARLEGAELWEARLEGAELWEARLGRTILTAAKCNGAALRMVDLSSTVDLTGDQVKSAFGDASVTLPEHLRPPPDHWPDWVMDREDFDNEWAEFRDNPDSYTPPPRPAESASD
ncbi:pentapeptide repeat-containing protein [Paracoccus tegillarcae]|uniref:Pentapeptide repeat-containing protein n=1 Tax=Paracoccus tegillarcae TaxID=1529068 RepID=A0A2K9F1X9_9RHOB|nr:pentapeptide repeat-containing protein [Paracoccus tegillarcae]AUH34372.1 hypothetical protein CUV01_14125 [Paracoccus tegillarcae]